MAVERSNNSSSIIDVLDRVLDKGIVIDAWVRVSLVGIDLLTVEARVVVASIDTYLRYSEAVSLTATVSRPTPAVVEAPPPSDLTVSPATKAPRRRRSAPGATA